MEFHTCVVCKEYSSSFYPNNKTTCRSCNSKRTRERKAAKKAAANGRVDADKWCGGCRTRKSATGFNRDGSQAGGLSTQCTACCKMASNRHRKRRQRTREDNPNTVSQCLQCGEWKANKEFRPTKPQCKACLAVTKCARWASDPQFRLKEIARARYTRELKKHGMDKTRASMELIGCSAAELRRHIESQFRDGMSWENHGNGEGKWNLDHIIACANFDFSIEAEQNKCFHYSNLQPLWWADNMRKGARMDWLPDMAQGVQNMLCG